MKLGILTNGLGIPRFIEFFDNDFKNNHPQTIVKDNLYRHRVTVERTINLLKDTFVLDSRCSHNSTTIKADTYLAAITQLLGVILADAIKKPELYKSIRKLIA